ncbi:MAG: type VI secretion system tip protein TssI/VgrG [Thermodesulfobacteriota bacterium]|nr:type VI secretion system tip protein TssI/VgrG [Thermodesulfobacteriota bacterium]
MARVDPGSEAKFLFQIAGTKLDTRVVEFTARERVSFPFELKVSLASEEEINFEEVVGKEALLTILGEEADRYLHGIISQFRRAGSRGRFFLYQATVAPALWLLSLEQDCRIFQNKDVQEIVKQIFKDAGIPGDRIEFRLQGQSPVREYCVQYRETDLNFISRLLEEEGIFYFFEHSEDRHVLVFADSAVAYKPILGEAEVPYNIAEGMVSEEESVYHFTVSREILSGKATQRDFNFEKPSLDLTTQDQGKAHQKLEKYDYPGKYVDKEAGQKLTKVRLQELAAFQEKAEGQSVCARFTPGFTFKLTDHDCDSFNREYFLVEVLHKGAQPQVLEEKAGAEGFRYGNDFLAIPSSVNFRPERKTPKPIAEGVQTAIVVGPEKEEIYTDKYGRVKVQFHWDREGKRDEKSSCWIRVAQAWAGKGWGILFTPRIGQEVIVEFLEGDPDRPVITGRVYNAEEMPPYELPKEKTKSTIKTNSSTGGDGFNEIRFEDKKGEEQLFIHAEKNQDIRVKNDCFEWIGQNRNLIVKKDQIEHVENNRHEIVDNDHLEEIGKDRHLKVAGKEAIEVGGSHSFTVGGNVIEVFKGNHNEQVAQNYYVKGMNVVIEGMTNLTIKVGGNFISLSPAGVFIKGTMVFINSGGSPGAGSAAMAVPPVAPIKALEADKAAPGQQPQAHKADESKKSWIEIELVDEDGNPVPGETYLITTPDGAVAQGTLDEKGLARVEGMDPGTCKITFPALDKDAWEKA